MVAKGGYTIPPLFICAFRLRLQTKTNDTPNEKGINMRTAEDIGIAGGAIAAALMKHLIFTGGLSLDAAQAILADAQKRLVGFPDGAEATRVIAEASERIAKEGEYF
jgi:cyanophycinase-like exopeptidase